MTVTHLRLTLAVFLLAACGGKDVTGDSGTGGTPPTEPDAPYQLIGDETELPAAALLSIWGSSVSDVWIVGADDGDGPVVLRWDGTAWSRIETGSTGDLWWVWGDGAGTMWFTGSGGRVLTHDIASGTTTEEVVTDAALTLFGVWGTSATDVWTVGGDVNGAFDGQILHNDGTGWTESHSVESNGGAARMAFKVWGRSASEAYVVGTNALVMEWDGAAWTEVVPSPLHESTPITTVHGDSGNVYAVGGYGGAAAAIKADGIWSDDSPPPEAVVPSFNGVNARDGVGVVACGVQGSLFLRAGGEWVSAGNPATLWDFHGCWIDPSGELWAVGGDLTNLTAGVVAYSGDAVSDIRL